MSGPPPKRAALRQRTNKTSTAAQLETTEQARKEAPSLGEHPFGPDTEWHSRTLEWWAQVWASPMAEEYLEADVDGLLVLAALEDAFWKKPNAGLAAEIRLQRQCYGLTPIDRRRLQWEVSRVEEAARKKPPKSGKADDAKRADPRTVLKAI